MQKTETSDPDPSPGVAPAWQIVRVEALAGARLKVAFADGTSGEVRMRDVLASDRTDGTVFEALRDPKAFAEVRVELFAVSWPNGADLAPDAIYDAIRKRGYWTVPFES